MKRLSPLRLATILLFAALALGCGPAPDAPPALPSISVPTLAGGSVSLPSLLGDKPLLIWFWAPW